MKKISKLLLVSLVSFFGISLATSQTAPSEIAHAESYEANWGVHELVQQADYELRDGATESQFISYGPSAQGQNWYSRSVANFYDLSKVTVLTSYKGYDTLLQNGTYSSSTVQEQINYLVDEKGYDVLGGINGTSFDTSNGAPTMGLMINGVEYCPGNYFIHGFFGIVKNEEGHQKAVIGRSSEYAGFRDGTVTVREENGVQVDYTGYKLWQAIGAWYDAMLVYNGELCPTDTWDEEHPRTAIGITAEGNVVTYVCEGRNGNRAGGLSLYNMATIMKDLGCVFAVNLDGGGSSTALSKHAGETTYKNRIEAAYGADRSVGDAVIFVSTESMSSEPVEHDNTFAKAHILPNNDLFVVGTTINFTATGSDAYGDPVDLPQDVVWELDTEKSTPNIGTIDPETGVFTATGTTSGNVYVNLKYNGVVVGSTKVDLTWPSWSYSNAFATNFTLGYNETKTLEFTLYPDAGEGNKALGISTWRPIILQECDLEWNLPIGCSMTQNQDGDFVFQAGDVPVVNGEVSIKQIKATGQTNIMTKKAIVSIGKAPDIIYDFEDTEWIKDFGKGGRGTSIYRTTKTDGGKVLFGDAALAIDYDFSDYNYIKGIDPNKGNNPSVTFYNDNLGRNPVVPAEAKYFGMWAFFPEGLDGCWFRVTLQGVDGSTATTTMTDFVSMPANPKVDRGIYGSGEWRFYYTEVGFDTRYGTAWSGMVGPYSIYSCQMMWSAFADTALGYDYNQPAGDTPEEVAANKEAARAKIEENFNKACRGTIYVDNIMALYGNPSSDMSNPYLSKINSTKESDNTYTLSFNVKDEDRYNADEVVGIKYGDSSTLGELQEATGINYSSLEVYLNGTLLTSDKYTLDQTTGLVTIPGLTELTAGTTVRVVAYDSYYNKLDRTSTLRSIEYVSGEEGSEEKVTYLYWDRDTVDLNTITPTPANKTGHTFSEWEYSTPVHSSMMPDSNVVVNATYTINQYTLKFEYDGQVVSEAVVDYNSDIVVPSLDEYSKVGHTFTGWDVTVPEKMPANDLTITAVLEPNKHAVTINDQNGNLVVKYDSVDYGTTIALPVVEGYTITWAEDTNTTMPDNDVTLVVNKVINQYTLKFEYDGRVVSEAVVDYNSDIVVPSLNGYSKVGHTFTGWNIVVPEKMPANDLTITAVFEVNKHNVIINDQDGNLIVKHENVAYGTTIALPTVEGYTLTWKTGTNTTMPDNDVTLVVNKVVNKHTVTINDQDGNLVVKHENVEYGSTIALPVVEGYTLTWKTGTNTTMPDNDVTLVVNKVINKHTVTINDQDGNLVVKHENVEYGTTIALPVVEGYTLTWKTGTNTTMPDSDVTLVVTKAVDKDYVTSFITAIKNAKTVDDKFAAFKQAEEVLGSYSDTEKQSISDLISEFEALKADYNTVVNNAKTDLNEARKITSWIISGVVASAVALASVVLKRRIF